MANLDKYDHQKIEDKWYSYWTDNNYFSSKPDSREPYTIVIPPPNITGSYTWAICLIIQFKIF